MIWTKYEIKFINFAIQRISKGASIYSQVKLLSRMNDALMQERTWESIRSKINREIRKRKLAK